VVSSTFFWIPQQLAVQLWCPARYSKQCGCSALPKYRKQYRSYAFNVVKSKHLLLRDPLVIMTSFMGALLEMPDVLDDLCSNNIHKLCQNGWDYLG
jgi:hypothetical protein